MIDCNLQHIKLNTLNSLADSGLGNMLFQIATCCGIAKKYNSKWQINDIIEVNEKLFKFGGNHKNTIYRNINSGRKKERAVYLMEKQNLYDDEILINIRLNLNENIIINGYFQSYKYFENSKKEILSLFEMDNNSKNFIKNKYPILFENKETVAIHIRNNWSNKYKYSEEYFMDAISRIPNINYYLIFSDDPENLEKTFLKNIKNKIWIKDNPDYIDLWMMSLCKNNILSHSTLSWWGAYLNQNPKKKIFYPELWVKSIYRKKSIDFQEKFLKSHYPSEWINLKSKVFI